MKPAIHRAVRRLVVAGLAVAMVAAAVPTGAAQQDRYSSSERTFYLHIMQYCDAASVIRWIDEFDWGNDLDGCGGNVLDPTTTSWTDVYPSFTPLYANVTAATTIEFHLFLLSRAADQTSVSATLDTGYSTCSGSAGPELIVANQVGGYTEFVIPCTFEAPGTADPLVKPKLTIDVDATYTYGMGTEGDHASYFVMSGVEPAPPKEEVQFFGAGERPRATFADEKLELEEIGANVTAEGGAPATGLLAATAATMGALVLARRRR